MDPEQSGRGHGSHAGHKRSLARCCLLGEGREGDEWLEPEHTYPLLTQDLASSGAEGTLGSDSGGSSRTPTLQPSHSQVPYQAGVKGHALFGLRVGSTGKEDRKGVVALATASEEVNAAWLVTSSGRESASATN